MNEAFKKMLMKKKEMEDPMSEGKKEARSSVLDDLMGNMNGRDGKKLGLKKVSVMAPDEKGLKEGLDKAKEIVGEEPSMEEESPEEESTESPEEEQMEDEHPEMEAQESDHSDKSPQELMEEIKKLKAELAARA